MELNGLNKGRKTTLSGQNRRLERGHSSQIQSTNLTVPYQPILNNTPARINEESNSSISQILSSVLNDSHCPTQVILMFLSAFLDDFHKLFEAVFIFFNTSVSSFVRKLLNYLSLKYMSKVKREIGYGLMFIQNI